MISAGRRFLAFVRRLGAFFAIGGRRVIAKATGPNGRRIRTGIAGVAIAIAILVLVTAVGVGLATESTVHGSDVDYWVVPEGGGGSVLVETGGTSLGESHSAAEQVSNWDAVQYATPVLMHPLQVESADGTTEYLLAVGVVNDDTPSRVSGLTPEALTPGDPHYADGSYDGDWTGELVASPAVASLLDVDTDDELGVVSENESFSVVAVDDGVSGPLSDTPVALVQLSELQTLTGEDEFDQADQLLVSTDSPAVEAELESLYPDASVETRQSLLASEFAGEDLSLALGATGLLVSLVIGVLFVCTTMGMEVIADRHELATMAALGVGSLGRLGTVGTQVVVTSLLGGVIGSLLGVAGIYAANRAALAWFDVPAVAVFDPLLLAYGVGTAVLIGLVALPYVFVLVRRLSYQEVITNG